MQLLHLHDPTDAQRLDEIITTFTPRVRSICPALGDAVLLPLIERMARRQLATERARTARRSRAVPLHRQRQPRQAEIAHLRAVS